MKCGIHGEQLHGGRWCRRCDRNAKRFKRYGITEKEVEAIRRDQGGVCALTGDPLLEGGHIDHIIPASRGGGNKRANLRLVCAQANLAKGRMLDDEFIALCRKVVRHAKTIDDGAGGSGGGGVDGT